MKKTIRRSLFHILKDHGLTASIEIFNLHSFLKYVECSRKKKDTSVQEYCRSLSKESLELCYDLSPCFDNRTEWFLERFGLSPDDKREIDENVYILLDHLLSQTGERYLHFYITDGKLGILDRLINAQKGGLQTRKSNYQSH